MQSLRVAVSAVVGVALYGSACTESSEWVALPTPPPPDSGPPIGPDPPPPPNPPPLPVNDPCARVFCSGRGTCQVIAGQALCQCEAGFVSDGVTCGEDRDQDGLSEEREVQAALEYAPVLRFSDGELFADRVPHWAATRASDGSMSVFYALSYFEDGGATILGINPHLGDSEFIVASIPVSGVPRYFLSAHFETTSEASRWVSLDGFERDTSFPGTHPIVYVAIGKHANYATTATCSAGAFGLDECGTGSDEVVQVLAGRNLGQSWAPLMDLVTMSREGGTASEWYWTDVPFCGWLVYSTNAVDRQNCVPAANAYRRQLVKWETGQLRGIF